MDGLGVWRGSLELYLLEDLLVGPSWIYAPFSQHQESHDYCDHSGGLCSEMKGWQENLRMGEGKKERINVNSQVSLNITRTSL